MERKLTLCGEYIQIRRKNGALTYGGDQGFYAGGQAGSKEKRKETSGCGIIALSDLLLYLANRGQGFATEWNMSYVNRILEQDEYQKYYDSIYEFLGGIPMKGGVSGIKLQMGFNRLARRQGWQLRSKWGLSGRKLWGRLEKMLEQDIPVILCIPMTLLKKDKGRGLPFYKKEEEGYRKVCEVSAHYVMVTGMLREKAGERTFLEISSWGKKYYICKEEYDELIHTVFLGILLGNILYIKSRKNDEQKGRINEEI